MSTPLPEAPGELGLSYELVVELDLAYNTLNEGTPDWAQVTFFTDADTPNEKTFVDAATYANKGADAEAIVGENWSVTFMHQMQRQPNGEYTDILAYLLEASKPGKRGKDARVKLRFYDELGAKWAFQGVAWASAARGAKGNKEIAGFTITLRGFGALVEISNPASSSAPSINAVTPPTAPTGSSVAIMGSGFSGVTQVPANVKFGATNATSFSVQNDELITAVVPAGAAGPANVVVTHPTKGASAPFTYSKGGA